MKMGPMEYNGNLAWLVDSTILLVRHGSHAYGLNTPQSDLDFKGVAVPPASYYVGLDRFEQAEFKDVPANAEAVVYELRKFLKLAADCNPNIIEVLWTDPSDHVTCTLLGQVLIDKRDLFISTKARHTFSGYAHAQLKRIKLHHSWHVRGETLRPPERADFDLPQQPIIPKEQLEAANAAIQKKIDEWSLKDLDYIEPSARIAIVNGFNEILGEMASGDIMWRNAAGCVGFDSNMIELLKRERCFKAAQSDWRSFLEWKANRNPKRAELEAKHGFDTKHASHLVRLLRMCKEILQTGKVIVKRPDREELLAIKNGAWTYEQLVEYAEREDASMDELYKASKLPRRVDANEINNLCVRLVTEHLHM